MKKQIVSGCIAAMLIGTAFAQQTQKPPLHGKHWMAITGKPLAATAGATIFNKGGNAVDAAKPAWFPPAVAVAAVLLWLLLTILVVVLPAVP